MDWILTNIDLPLVALVAASASLFWALGYRRGALRARDEMRRLAMRRWRSRHIEACIKR